MTEPAKAVDLPMRLQLWALCTSVAFERAAFYGLQSILALYLADVLLDEGSIAKIWLLPALARFTQTEGLALAGVITGIFVSTAALAPAIGGIISDRAIGTDRSILAGGAMMAFGHGLLMQEAALLPALGLIALGSGLFKGPVAAKVSGFYAQDDPRRVEGFRLFYIAINIAGLAAPLVIGTLGERVYWHAAFGMSCVFMLVGLAIYYHRFRAPSGRDAPARQDLEHGPMTRRTSLSSLVLLGLSIALLTVPNAQLTNAYLLWVSQSFERSLWGWVFPASWMIAADGTLSLVALAASGLFWRWYEQRFGALPAATKAMIGAVFVVMGAVLLVLTATLHEDTRVPVLWGLGFQLCNSLGLANVLPAAMAIFGQSSARRHAATVMSGFYLSLFASGLASTWLASQFTSLPITTFWLLHALCVLGGAIGLTLSRSGSVRRELAKS